MFGESVSGVGELCKELDELEAMSEEIENDVKMVCPSETESRTNLVRISWTGSNRGPVKRDAVNSGMVPTKVEIASVDGCIYK